MNCKPGDLAIVVAMRVRPDAVGKIVRCVSFDPHPDTGEPAWRIDPPLGASILHEGSWRPGNWVLDRTLRPIRADGISDEEVRDLYAPKVPEAA